MYIISKLPIIILFAIFFISCNGGKMEEKQIHYNAIKDIPASAWKKLSQKKIYFGHQSVGFNIIDGIKDLMKKNPEIKLNIIETSSPADFTKGVFAHSRVGKNKLPESKADSFADIINDGLGNSADIAFFKFCYVDINSQTDVNKVFKHYKETMAKLKNNYPKTKFVHFTIPLEITKISLKTRIKMLIGKKDIWELDSNIRKNKYNELLIKEYKDKEPVFDIAKFESTYSNGKRSTFTKQDKTWFSLAPEYTYDDGHLNETGRGKVAEQLLILLVNL